MVSKVAVEAVYNSEGEWTGKYRCPNCGAFCYVRLDTPKAPVAGKNENTWCNACGLGVPEEYENDEEVNES